MKTIVPIISAIFSVNCFANYQKAEFLEIKPGKFYMSINKIETEISKPFSMMSTEMTQYMYAQLQLLTVDKVFESEYVVGPTYNPYPTASDNPQAEVYQYNGETYKIMPNDPVVYVNHLDVQGLIVNLNHLSATGTAQQQNELQTIIPDHKKGDIYNLPTEAQWEFVMRNRGFSNELYFDMNDPKELEKYSWIAENSTDSITEKSFLKLHPVATKAPRLIDGNKFYDLEGNVSEWTRDGYENNLPGGLDPELTSEEYSLFIVRGGNSKSKAVDSNINNRGWNFIKTYSDTIGFRLVRVRP